MTHINDAQIKRRIDLGQMHLNERFGYEQNVRTGEIVPPKLRSLFYHNRYNKHIMDSSYYTDIDWTTVKNSNVDVLTTEKSIMAALNNIQKDDGLLFLTDDDNNILCTSDRCGLYDAISNNVHSFKWIKEHPDYIRQKITKGYYISRAGHDKDTEPRLTPFKNAEDAISREQDRVITQNWTLEDAHARRVDKRLGREDTKSSLNWRYTTDGKPFFSQAGDDIPNITDTISYYNKESKMINNAVKKIIKCFENNRDGKYINLANRLTRVTDEYLHSYKDFLDIAGKLQVETGYYYYTTFSRIATQFTDYIDEIISVAESCCNISSVENVDIMDTLSKGITSLINHTVRYARDTEVAGKEIRENALPKNFSGFVYDYRYTQILQYANNPLKNSTEICDLIYEETDRISNLADKYEYIANEPYVRQRFSRAVRNVCKNLAVAAKAVRFMLNGRSIETGTRKIVKEYILFIKLVTPYIVKSKLPGSNERDVLYRKLNAIAKRLNTAISESVQHPFRHGRRLW